MYGGGYAGAPPPGYSAPQQGYGQPGFAPQYAPQQQVYGAPPPPPQHYGPPPATFCYAAGFQPMNPAAYALFQGVDRNRSGTVDAHELHAALSSGGYTSFSYKTTKLLMRMFDSDMSGALGYKEFESLLAQLGAWRAWFQSADADRSGKLSPPELARCLQAFGFNLPQPTVFSIFSAVRRPRAHDSMR